MPPGNYQSQLSQGVLAKVYVPDTLLKFCCISVSFWIFLFMPKVIRTKNMFQYTDDFAKIPLPQRRIVKHAGYLYSNAFHFPVINKVT